MIFGPNMQNFQAIADAFVRAGGAARASDAAQLEAAIAELLDSREGRETMGRNALKVVKENQGAIDRTVEMIVESLDKDELYFPAGS
jgi:3-deoxy-D-manno-octulosonic-acid transferase